MKKIRFIFLAFLIFAPPAAAEELFDTHFNDYAENLADAQDEGKDGIFIYFHMEECPFCQKMERNVFNQIEVVEYFKTHFLNFKVDIESSLDLIDFDGNPIAEKYFAARYYRVRATPVLAFFDLNGERVARRTGFVDTDEFLLLARYVVEKAYLHENFVRYKRRHL